MSGSVPTGMIHEFAVAIRVIANIHPDDRIEIDSVQPTSRNLLVSYLRNDEPRFAVLQAEKVVIDRRANSPSD